jgi:hypothetical protein
LAGEGLERLWCEVRADRALPRLVRHRRGPSLGWPVARSLGP